MRRFIITGAPGAGKTAIIRQLELDGFGVVEEAATAVIAAAEQFNPERIPRSAVAKAAKGPSDASVLSTR